jgi:hypothetical protein
MAMGADSRSIVRLVLRRGAGELAIGVITGLALATLIARGIESLLFETSTTDPLVFTTVSVTLVAIASSRPSSPAEEPHARTPPRPPRGWLKSCEPGVILMGAVLTRS